MAGKEGFIDSYLLNTDDPYPWFELDDLIDQQEREAVRQDLLNGDGIKDCHNTQ